MAEQNRCSAQGCEQLSAARLETSAFCRGHFISTCYARLEECTKLLKERPFRDTAPALVGRFVHECVAQANDLALRAEDLDNLERARLLDIMFWAGDLGHRLRRGLRKKLSVPLRVRCEELGRPWEEETETQLVSRHGAQVPCQHRVEIGDTLLVMRMDTGRQARARVAWREREDGGRQEIGIEFLDFDNFWELEGDTGKRGT